MAIQRSTGMVQAEQNFPSRKAVGNGKILLFSGAVPTDADAADTGTLLCTLTKSKGAWTAETRASWTITLSGTNTAAEITSIEMNAGPLSAGTGPELLAATVSAGADLAATAALLAAAINNNITHPNFEATVAGAVVTVWAPIGSGTAFNSTTLTCTATTITATVAAGDGTPAVDGVAAANGCNFDIDAVAGVCTSSETWSGDAVAAGTATHFRLVTDGADAGTASSSTYRRMQGTVGLVGSGADMELVTTTFVISPSATPVSVTGATFTIDK